jgi:hypothetical protein
MRSLIWTTFLLTLVSGAVIAQVPAPASAEPARLCIATFKNETKHQVDSSALRDRLSVYLKRGPLAKQYGVEIMPIKEDTEQAAAPEVKELHCDFVVFSRVLLGRLKDPRPDPNANSPMPMYNPNRDMNQQPATTGLVTGVQFTAVRVSSSIPVLIDRVFLDKLLSKEEELWPLLIVMQEHLEGTLQKKIAPAKPS